MSDWIVLIFSDVIDARINDHSKHAVIAASHRAIWPKLYGGKFALKIHPRKVCEPRCVFRAPYERCSLAIEVAMSKIPLHSGVALIGLVLIATPAKAQESTIPSFMSGCVRLAGQ